MGGWISVTQATAWISERSENSFHSQTSRLPTHSIVPHSSKLNVLYIEHWSTQAVLRLTELHSILVSAFCTSISSKFNISSKMQLKFLTKVVSNLIFRPTALTIIIIITAITSPLSPLSHHNHNIISSRTTITYPSSLSVSGVSALEVTRVT